MNQKCPACGLVNWSDAPECKRCKAPLQAQEMGEVAATPATMPVYEPMPAFDPMPVVEQKKPAIALGIMMIVWGLVIFLSGVFLLSFGEVFHVLVLGPATLISGIELIRGKRWAMVPYFVGVIVMVVWLTAEGNHTAAAGSFLFSGLIGLLVIKRRWPVLAGGLMVFSTLGFIGAMALGTLLLRPANVAWRSFQPPVGNFTLQMPADIREREPIVEKRPAFTMTKHLYESRVWGQGTALYIVIEYSPTLPVVDRSVYERALDAELDNYVKNTGSTLLLKQPLACHGYPGLSFELTKPENSAGKKPRTVGRIFMSSEHMYIMQLTASDSSELMANSIKFLDPVPLHTFDGAQAQR